MPKGKLIIRQKEDGSLSRFIQLPGQRKLGIPMVFMLDFSMKGKECDYETNSNGAIVKIVVEGKEVPINTDLAKSREEQLQRKQEQAEQQKKEEQQARKQEQLVNQPYKTPISRTLEAFDPSRYSKLPSDTRLNLKGTQDGIDNLALRLFKGVNFWEGNKNKATLYQRNRGRKGAPDELMQHLPSDWSKFNYGGIPFAAIAERSRNTVKAIYGEHIIEGELRSSNRLAIGIGGSTVFEVGFTLHHTFGIPYIPASSIKGLTRSWMIQQYFAGNEVEALVNRDFCDLFGCPAEWEEELTDETSINDDDKKKIKHLSWYAKNPQFLGDKGERKGKVIFFDAFPLEAPRVEEDVMNVHYPDYYQAGTGSDKKSGNTLPTDYQKPIPIVFLTIAAQTNFRFIVAANEATVGESKELIGRLLKIAMEVLLSALTSHGIGAKTAVGYGYFSPLNPQ